MPEYLLVGTPKVPRAESKLGRVLGNLLVKALILGVLYQLFSVGFARVKWDTILHFLK
jgi:hypothetical protein